MPFRLNFSGNKNKSKGLDFFDVSYRFHDAGSNQIIVYNNSRSRKTQITLHIKDSNGITFSVFYEEILASTALMISLVDLTNDSNSKFQVPASDVAFSYMNQETKFIPEGNKFNRVK